MERALTMGEMEVMMKTKMEIKMGTVMVKKMMVLKKLFHLCSRLDRASSGLKTPAKGGGSRSGHKTSSNSSLQTVDGQNEMLMSLMGRKVLELLTVSGPANDPTPTNIGKVTDELDVTMMDTSTLMEYAESSKVKDYGEQGSVGVGVGKQKIAVAVEDKDVPVNEGWVTLEQNAGIGPEDQSVGE